MRTAASWWFVGALLVLVVETVLVATEVTRPSPPSYAASGAPLRLLEVVAAIALVCAAAASARVRPAAGLTTLGAAWLLPEAAVATWPSLGVLGELAAVLSLVAAALFLVGAGSARNPVLAGGLATLVLARLLRSPYDDPLCWRSCSPTPWPSMPVTWSHAAEGLAALLVGVAGWWLARGRRGAPASAARLVVATLAVQEVARVLHREGQGSTVAMLLQVVAASCLFALAAVVLLETLTTLRLRAVLEDLATDLARVNDPPELVPVLSRAMADKNLEVIFRHPLSGAWLTPTGIPTVGPSGAGDFTTLVVRDGEVVAAILVGSPMAAAQLDAVLGAGWRLLLDLARLRAVQLADLEALHTSRLRLVQTSDRARRALERNLHDGAQQSLVGLAIAIRLAERHAAGGHDPELCQALVRLGALAHAALGEVRSLARGVPPALAESDLAVAIAEAAARHDATLSIRGAVRRGANLDVLTTAYLAADCWLAEAATTGAAVTMAVAVVEERLVLEVYSPAVDGTGQSTADHLEDRIDALGGRRRRGPGHYHLELPCGS